MMSIDFQILDQKTLFLNYFEKGFYVFRNLYRKDILLNNRFRENIKVAEDTIFDNNVLNCLSKVVYIKNPLYIVENFDSLTQTKYNLSKFKTLDSNIYINTYIKKWFTDNLSLLDKSWHRLFGNAVFHYHNLSLILE